MTCRLSIWCRFVSNLFIVSLSALRLSGWVCAGVSGCACEGEGGEQRERLHSFLLGRVCSICREKWKL